MNIFAHSLGDSALFSTIRTLALLISYLFLFNFAARGRQILFLRPLKQWVYLILVGFYLFFLIFLGPKGTLAVLHFSFALIVGGYCVLIIYLYSYREKAGGSLRAFSLFSAAYFVLRGLIIPKSAFFITNWINYTFFSNLFGFPVQLALFVLILAAVCAFLVNIYHTISEIHAKYGKRISPTIPLFTLLILIAFVFTGSVFTFYWGTYTRGEKKKITLLRIENISSHIQSILGMTGEVAHSLADSGEAKDALKYRNTLAIEQLNDRLDDYVESFGLISVCYVMENKGFVIASSNRNSPASFLGKNYAFRPYFNDALKGRMGSYFALGITSAKRGFYASYPVKDERGNIAGVAAVKMDISGAEDIFRSFPRAFLVSPEGIIFMSSRRQDLFRSFYPVDNVYKQKFISSRQFGNIDFKPLLKKECFQDDEVLLDNNPYYVFREFIGYGGWSIVILWHNKPVLVVRLFCISVTLFLVILFLLFIVVLSKREEIFNKISQISSEHEAVLNATGGIIIISVDTEGQILSSNSGAERMLGYKEYELRGKNITECIFVKDEVDSYADAVTKETGRILEGFYALVEKARHNIITQRQLSLLRKDKTNILVKLSITAKRGPSGEVAGFIFTAFDITEFKNIQEQLCNEKNRIALYLDTASVIMMMLDKKGRVVFINKRGSDILGYNPDEIIGKDWLDNFLPSEESDNVRNVFDKLIKGEVPDVGARTHYVSTKVGKKLISWRNAVIYGDNGQVTGILSSGDDITGRVEKEEELKIKIDELEKFQKLVMDRELRMRELKKRIRELEENSS